MQQARLLATALLPILFVVSLPASCTAQANPPARKPTKKEDLRYDGKSFDYWCNYLTTELKAERRIDAVACYFEDGTRPKILRLHFVRKGVLTA